jgi:transposase InsO family protein
LTPSYYLLKKYSDATAAVAEFIPKLCNLHNTTIEWIRFDNGGEFVNKTMRKLLKKHSFTMVTSAPYTPSHNGLAERKNCSLIQMTRCLLFGS